MSPAEKIHSLLKRFASAKSAAERRTLTRRLARAMDRAPAERDRFFLRHAKPSPDQGRFLLGLARRLVFPWPDPLVNHVVEMLLRPDLSRSRRVSVARRLTRSPHADRLDTRKLMAALTAGLSSAEAEKVLATFGKKKERGPVATCPRCNKSIAEDKLADHMLKAHRLAWDNGRPIDPWAAMRGWAAKYRASQDPAMLDRATDLARRLDGPEGLDRLTRLVASLGQSDPKPADDPHAPTICPACYASIEPPSDFDPPKVLALSRDLEVGPFRLSRRHNRLEITEDHRPLVEGPIAVRPAPSGRPPTRAVWALLGVAALMAGLWPISLGPPPLAVAAVVLALASLLYWLGSRRGSKFDGPGEMAGLAWEHLAPVLAKGEPSWEASGALAGLSAARAPDGSARERLALLEGLSPALRRSAAEGKIPAAWLVPVAAREISDLAASGGDPVPRLARAVGLCWSGQVPLSSAEGLLTGAGFEEFQRLGRARLRVLLLKAAFEAGLYPNDIQELGRAVPALGSAVASEDALGAARLRSLWSLERAGRAKELSSYWTCFDLAATPSAGVGFLDAEPNLLMVQPPNEWVAAFPEVEAIRATEEGIFCGPFTLTTPQVNIRVKNVGVMSGGYEVTVGKQMDRIASDPQWIISRLKAWQAYLFGRVLAGAVDQMRGDGDAAMARLMDQVQADCPECRVRVLRQPGGLGIPVVRAE